MTRAGKCMKCHLEKFLIPLEDNDQNHTKMQVCRACKRELKKWQSSSKS